MKEYGYFPSLIGIFQGAVYGTPFKKGFPGEEVIYFSNEDDVLPGFKTISTPGHTPDSVSFFDRESGILITGDFLLVINNKLLFNTYVSDKKDQEDSITRIKAMEGIKCVYPGHGNPQPFNIEC